MHVHWANLLWEADSGDAAVTAFESLAREWAGGGMPKALYGHVPVGEGDVDTTTKTNTSTNTNTDTDTDTDKTVSEVSEASPIAGVLVAERAESAWESGTTMDIRSDDSGSGSGRAEESERAYRRARVKTNKRLSAVETGL